MGQIAHIVVSHRNVEQVERLVGRLAGGGSGNDVVVIHHDPTGEPWNRARCAEFPNVVFLRAKPVEWGSWSQVEAVLRGFEFALSVPDVEWVIVHSGQDYPLVSNQKVHELLDHASCDGFMWVASLPFDFDPPALAERETREMILRAYYYVAVPRFFSSDRIPVRIRRLFRRGALILNARQRVVRISMDGFWNRDLVGVRTTDRWLNGLVPHKAEPWMMLSRKAAGAVIEASENERFIRRYRRTLAPDESFFGTVLANRDDLKLCSRSYRFIRWTSGAHPDLLTTADFDELVASGDCFARKFDATVDCHVLDLLDARIDSGGAPSR